MHHPSDLRYSASHEWVRVEGNRATIGITDFAQHELGDVVYVELPEGGKSYKLGAVFGTVESVKAASDLYAPVSCTILDSNGALGDAPESINNSPYGNGWMIVVELTDPSELDALMDAAAYEASIGGE